MRTLIIGDIHGCLEELKLLIEKAGPVDQIISCGDLIDRGPHSYETIKFCQANNIQVCLGNHEMMAIDALTDWLDKTKLTFKRLQLLSSDWFNNGGKKVFESIPDEELPSILEYFKSLPIFITTTHTINNLPVVVSHTLISRQLSDLSSPLYYNSLQAISLVWSRQLPQEAKYFNIHGHTPTDFWTNLKSAEPMVSNYHINLDTGCCYNTPSRGVLTGITLPDMKFHTQAKL